MRHTIEEFSAVFSFGHSTTSSTEKGDLCYEISDYKDFKYEDIFHAVQILGLKYQANFYEAVIEIFRKQEKILASKKKFMSFVLSRCMKLSEIPTLFNFLVVCTFVDTVVFCICNDVECFRIVKMASKCVTAAFYRRYVDLFDKENGFKGFSNYCRKLNATVLKPSEEDSETDPSEEDSETDSETDSEDSLDLKGFTPPDTDKVIDLLQIFRGIDDSDFLLTDFEKKLLYDRDELPLDIDPAEDIFIPYNGSSESIKVESLDLALQHLSIQWKKVLERVNYCCTMCEDNCYKHVVLIAEELAACEV